MLREIVPTPTCNLADMPRRISPLNRGSKSKFGGISGRGFTNCASCRTTTGRGAQTISRTELFLGGPYGRWRVLARKGQARHDRGTGRPGIGRVHRAHLPVVWEVRTGPIAHAAALPITRCSAAISFGVALTIWPNLRPVAAYISKAVASPGVRRPFAIWLAYGFDTTPLASSFS